MKNFKVSGGVILSIFLFSLSSAFAQVQYVPGKYGGYRTPIYGYQEKDSTFRIVHSSQTAPHTSPFGGIFEINQNGEQTDELLTGGTRVWGACYDNKRGKLIISDNGNGGLWQSDAVTHVVDWEKVGTSITDISILPDGRIVGYRNQGAKDIWVFDTLGNNIKVIPQPTDCRFSGKFLPYGKNQFVNIGYIGNAADTLNWTYSMVFILNDSLDVVKRIEVPSVIRVEDIVVTTHSQLLIASTPITQQDWSSGIIIRQWGVHLLSLVDTNGILLWKDTIGTWVSDGRRTNDKVTELSNGIFFHVCQGDRWLMFTKVSPTGDVLNIDSIGYTEIAALGKFPKPEFTGYCFPVSLEKTLDNGFYLVWKNKVPTFQAEDNYGCWAMKLDSLGNFWWPWSTGVKNVNTTDFNIYPNPVQNNLTIEVNEPGFYQLSIATTTGQVVYEASVKDKETINTDKWGKGVYFYTLTNGNKVIYGKVLKF